MARPATRRAADKAVLRTNQGWLGYNFAEGAESIRPSGHRRDSRLEFIIDQQPFPDADQLERELKACLDASGARAVAQKPKVSAQTATSVEHRRDP